MYYAYNVIACAGFLLPYTICMEEVAVFFMLKMFFKTIRAKAAFFSNIFYGYILNILAHTYMWSCVIITLLKMMVKYGEVGRIMDCIFSICTVLL